MMMIVNVVYLIPHLPKIGMHENHYVFSDKGHMEKASEGITDAAMHEFRSSSNNSNSTSNKKGSRNAETISVGDWMKQLAGIDLTPEMEANLPSWSKVREVVGDGPVVLGLESCPRFRDIVPPLERMLGAAGMFNTGTNLVTHLLKKNCEIPERRELHGPNQSKESYGMRWQVPWGKHTPVKFRMLHSTQHAAAIKKEYVLPVVTIRHPYSWLGSMCKNSYAAKWPHKRDNCPHLKQGQRDTAPWNPVTVTYAEDRKDHHISAGHLWNDWYSYYLEGPKRRGGGDDFPYVVVRMEDLIFYPQETTRTICECAGGKIRDDQPFQLITDSAKGDSKGHDASTGIYEAWIKYSQPNTKERYGFTDIDYRSALKALNGTLMESFGYKHPS